MIWQYEKNILKKNDICINNNFDYYADNYCYLLYSFFFNWKISSYSSGCNNPNQYFIPDHSLSWSIVFYVFHNLIRENNKVKQLIANIICTFICIFLGYALITDSYVSILRGNIKGDFLLWQDVLLDLHDSDVKSIDNLKIKDFYFPGEVSHTSASRDSLYIVAVDKEGTSYRFPITQKDKLLITDKDNSELRSGEIEYYKKSGLMKSISFSKENQKTSEIQMVEIILTKEEIAHEKRILVNRPEVDSYDKNLFWYVTKNGEFSKCFQAYSKTWTNFLTFADKGDYTVTLVTDYYADTGEYTPISNTIEYTIE